MSVSVKNSEAQDQTFIDDSAIVRHSRLGALLRKLFSACCRSRQEVEIITNPVKKKLLVLDLDETLVHASNVEKGPADKVLNLTKDNTELTYYLYKRPHLEEFLSVLHQLFDISIFTASLQEYADRVIDFIDPQKLVTQRRFRDSCTYHKGKYIKDLRIFNRNLKDIVLLDNSPGSFVLHPNNGIGIHSWFGDPRDSELRRLLPFLEAMATVECIPSMIEHLKHRKLKAT